VDGLKEDSKSLDPKFGKSEDEESPILIMDLETVIESSNLEKKTRKLPKEIGPN
jgi:hypothetical protein